MRVMKQHHYLSFRSFFVKALVLVFLFVYLHGLRIPVVQPVGAQEVKSEVAPEKTRDFSITELAKNQVSLKEGLQQVANK